MFNFIDKQSDLDTVNYIAKSVDIEVLEKELEETAQKIKDNQFEPDCEDCEGCPFRKICKK